MATDPLRNLCPRAVVVWRDAAARCSKCNVRLRRRTAAHAWQHPEPDGVDDALDAARYALEAWRLIGSVPDEVVLDGSIRVAEGARVFVGVDPATRVDVGGITSAEAIDGAITVGMAIRADAARALGLEPDLEAIVGLATTPTVNPEETS